jgi:1-acyl-sn-glycerol-3-phosphate acyltransferase
MTQAKDSPADGVRPPAVYRLAVGILRCILFFGARVRVSQEAQLPEGACIVASNHISHFDPPLISGSFRRVFRRDIDWLAMQELFGHPASKRFFEGANVIPVNRGGGDRTSLRVALRRLALGRMVGIFPEGGIRDGEVSILNGAPMKAGVALLASMAKAPIVPVVIIGSDRLYNKRRWFPGRRATVWIGIGRAFSPLPDRAETENRLAEEIIGLKERVMVKYGLTAADLPHPPKERMAEA